MTSGQIEQLEASLDAPPTAASEALAAALTSSLLGVPADASHAEREDAAHGLMLLSQHYYRQGELAQANLMLANAHALTDGLSDATRVGVLLRRGEFELLVSDIGAALDHTAEAMEIARVAGRRVDEARAWTNYGMALQAAGLAQQADERLAHALDLIHDLDEPRLAGNIWALRSQLGWHLEDAGFQQAVHACQQALKYAKASPARFRDAMVCTAYCNSAALEILRGDLDAAKTHLANAAALANLGRRPRWLIETLEAMSAIRAKNGAPERAALNALLAPDQAPAQVYVIETYSVMAAMFTAMGDGDHAHEALVQLSAERARALWATLSDPAALDTRPVAEHAVASKDHVPTMGLLERLAVTAELRDDATGKHCFRVGRLSMLLARRVGLPEADVNSMDLAARLHDIGKFAIPDAILLKPTRLDAAETQLMRTHTTIGADLLAQGNDGNLQMAEVIARHHHEFWDGSGYPFGLAGKAIPVNARITALADVYDALTHVRPYKAAWLHAEAMAYIRSMRGIQFDPQLTDFFMEMMAEAERDLASFLVSLEAGALTSPFIVAESRMANALAAET
ncbi:MAG: HD domain-containing phosphohydrolase [Betaproteobacteria bacterium]